jgi:hypothetical protein
MLLIARIVRLSLASFTATAITLAILPAAAEPLTLRRVMLSSGGVGYFEHEARIDGNATLELELRLDQIDDVLKSLVVYDDKGGIGSVVLPGREPLAQAFRDLPFEPSALSSPVALFGALQGAEVTVTGARTLSGRIISVVEERMQLPGPNPAVIARHRVSLMTPTGLQQFVLQEAESVQFSDPKLKGQVETALAAIAQHRTKDKRTLTIAANGQGARTVRVAYVVATPLWKTAYRVTLPPVTPGETDGPNARAHMQGWAVVENMTGQDWSKVELTLVSGSPVTFRQALYQAYYVNRPDVPVEVMGRVLPRLDQGAVALEQQQLANQLQRAERSRAAGGALAAAPPAPATAKAARDAREDDARRQFNVPIALADAIAAAESEEATTQVAFRFPQPVSVESGQTLTIPVVNREVPARRLALYQPQTHARHPLAAVRLSNDAKDGQGTGLPPGVLTLYERGRDGQITYVGDARLGALPAGEQRLVSYALDQKVLIDREEQGRRSIGKGTIDRGVFRYLITERQSVTYRVKGAKLEARSLIIEHPRQGGWKLVQPLEKDTEMTDGFYRLSGELPKDGATKIEVVLELPRIESVQIAQINRDQISFFANAQELDKPVRDAFVELAKLQGEVDKHARRQDELNGQRKRLVDDQSRLRDNLNRTPSNSDIHRRYLTKLNEQESEIEKLDGELRKAEDAQIKAKEAVAGYIAGLKL